MKKEQTIKECETLKRCLMQYSDEPDNIKSGQAIETVLNMLKENSAEIEQKNTELAEKSAEIEKKDKQIDLMAEFIFQNIDVEEEICNSAYIECKQETAQDITCINCIKQYFERKVNHGN